MTAMLQGGSGAGRAGGGREPPQAVRAGRARGAARATSSLPL